MPDLNQTLIKAPTINYCLLRGPSAALSLLDLWGSSVEQDWLLVHRLKHALQQGSTGDTDATCPVCTQMT